MMALLVPMKAQARLETPIDSIIEQAERYEDDLARVVMSEANGEPMVGKVAVVATIFNRARIYDQTIAEVIYSPNQYSTANNGKPTKECYEAITLYCECPTLWPDDLVYFQLDSFSKYGEAYAIIGSHYFSTLKVEQREEMEEEIKCFTQYEMTEFALE